MFVFQLDRLKPATKRKQAISKNQPHICRFHLVRLTFWPLSHCAAIYFLWQTFQHKINTFLTLLVRHTSSYRAPLSPTTFVLVRKSVKKKPQLMERRLSIFISVVPEGCLILRTGLAPGRSSQSEVTTPSSCP